MDTNGQLTDYKYKCYDDLNQKIKHILDKIGVLELVRGIDINIEARSVISVMNVYFHYIEDCATFREVSLLYNIVLEFLDPIESDLFKYIIKTRIQ